MNLIIFSHMTTLITELSEKLTPQGLNIFHGFSLNQLVFSKGLKYHFCMIDEADYDPQDILSVLDRVRSNDLKRGKKLILLSKMSSQQSIQNYMISGLDYIIPRFLTPQTLALKTAHFIQNNCHDYEQRQHARFNIFEHESAFVNLFGHSKITNISMGGIAVNLQKTPSEKELLNLQTTYSKTQIICENYSIFADLKLIKTDWEKDQTQSPQAVFQFQALDEQSKNDLAQYIFFKTQAAYAAQP